MKRILFIAHRVPFPPRKGDKIRSYNQLKFLSRYYRVDLVSFFDRSDDVSAEVELRKFCSELHLFEIRKGPANLRGGLSLLTGRSFSQGYFHVDDARKQIDRLVRTNRYAFTFCFSSQTAPFVLNAPGRKIMDLCDVDSEKFAQYGRFSAAPMRWIYRMESRLLAKLERKIAGHFDATLLSTQAELDLFRSLAPEVHGFVLPNGVDANYFQPICTPRENAIVFTGEMDYFANVDAVVWFCEEVLPQVLRTQEDLRFYIVGRRPVARVRELAKRFPQNVVVTGSIFDVRPYIARSKLAVVPVRIARGVQNKVLEAMAMTTPVLVHRKLAAAFDRLDESLLFSFESASECAEAVLALTVNGPLLNRTGQALREYVLEHHDWGRILRDSAAWGSVDSDFAYRQTGPAEAGTRAAA